MTDKKFEDLLRSTGMIHWRMPVDESASLEHRLLHKEITRKENLWSSDDVVTPSVVPVCWKHSGLGRIYLNGSKHLVMETAARTDSWPEGSPADGDYCAFGSLQAALLPVRQDWQDFNRLHFHVYADCPGMHSPMIALQLYNDGTEKIPDKYMREGYHTIHLKNHSWNECIWEFPSLPRDAVTRLVFEVNSYGQELSMSNTVSFCLSEVALEHTPGAEHTLGWNCSENSAVFSTAGYWMEGYKSAVTCMDTESFQVVRAEDNQAIYSGIPKKVENEKGTFYVWDFSSLTSEGSYYLQSGEYESSSFPIAAHPLYEPVWKVLNFLYCERCGGPVGGGHGTCHGDILARHNGLTLSYNGGWHDAGDVSQQTLQSGEVVHALLEMAERVKTDAPGLYFRIMEEAAWGLDFILRMRFGDGYRATSAGIRRFTDGLTGNMDDCEARVHNHAFENFLFSGIEAFAAGAFESLDPGLSEKCYQAACEDYNFAKERFAEKGMELPVFFEHSYNSSLAQYWATASWSASMIYLFKGDSLFGEYAVHYAKLMLSCQETGNKSCPLSGFFYREPDKKVIIHFNHQSREQIFMQALSALCLSQPEHEALPLWENSMKLYAGYLKQIYAYASPYGMLPAGIHRTDEYLDEDTFSLLHLMTTYEEDSVNYKEQLANGIPLGGEYCLRQFPVWFSFRGNTAVHLANGKAAAILGNYLQDPELTEIAREQLYWTFGKNPFGQSLVYGAGSNYAQQYGALNGEMAGSIPVGIETRGNDDIPFWPMENNATYKEVWTSSAGHWLWVASEIY